jgi:hypothetical protein
MQDLTWHWVADDPNAKGSAQPRDPPAEPRARSSGKVEEVSMRSRLSAMG